MPDPLLVAIAGRLGDALGRGVVLRGAQVLGGGYFAPAGKMMDVLSAEA